MQYSHLPPAEGQWIVDACSQADPLTVTAQVPMGYERYVRVLHPALDEDDQQVRWSTVAASRSHILTAADLFETIAGLDSTGNPVTEDAWVDTDLPLDELPMNQWKELALHLISFSGDQQFIAGLWAGYAFIEGGERIQIELEPDPAKSEDENATDFAAALAEAQKPAFSTEDLAQGPLELGGGYRNYHLFDVDAAFLSAPLWARTADGEQRQRPALAFPQDRSWMLSTEPYDDCTMIGGPAALIAAILRDPTLESIEVGQFTRIGHSN